MNLFYKQHNLKGLSLVACIPDQAIWIKNFLSAKIFLEQYEESSDVSEEAGWLRARPCSPDRTRAVRMDRDSLKSLVRQTAAAGTIPLRSRASLALKNPLGMANGILVSMSRSLLPGILGKSYMTSNSPWTTLRFFGALSPTQQTAALNGATFRLNSLPSKAHEVLNEVAFSTEAQVQLGIGAADVQNEPDLLAVMSRRSRASMSGQQIEPTEAFGSGFQPGAYVQIGVFDSHVFQADAADKRVMDSFGSSGLDDLAIYLEMSAATAGTPVGSSYGRLEKIRLGKRSELKFVFQLAPEMYIERSLLDDSFGDQSESYALSNLPQGIIDALNSRREQFKILGTVMRMLSNGEGGIQIVPPSN